MNTLEENKYIEKREGVCGGKEVIKGHRVAVWLIAKAYNQGADWGELATRFETISVLEIRKAIEYYENNKEVIDQQIEDNKLENVLDSDIPNSHVLNGPSESEKSPVDHNKETRGDATSKTKVPDDRIEIDEDVMMGKPFIQDTRITVERILRKLSQDFSIEVLLADYPNLTRDDVRAALKYAADSIGG